MGIVVITSKGIESDLYISAQQMDIQTLAGHDSRAIFNICGRRRQINAMRRLLQLQRQLKMLESLGSFGFPSRGWMTRASEFFQVHRGTISQDWGIVLRDDALRRDEAALNAAWKLNKLAEASRLNRLAS